MEEKKKIQSFRDLITWQEGRRLVLLVYSETKRFPKEEMFGLTSQMRRCAVSITSNIAEGFSRQSYKEKIQFYSIAQGSVTELQNQLLVSKDVGYLKQDEYTKAADQAEKVHRILNGLLKSSKNFSRGYAAVCLSLFFILHSLFSLPLPASAAVLSKPPNNLGLVGYWSFNEGKGTAVGDTSGNANLGTLNGDATWIKGKLGQGLTFDGTGDYVSYSHAAPLSFERTDPFSISLWAKTTNLTDGAFPLFEKKATDTGPGYAFAVRNASSLVDFSLTGTSNSNRIYWRTNSPGATFTNWNHYVVTYDGSSGVSGVKVYVNTSSRSSSYTENTLNTSTINAGGPTLGSSLVWGNSANGQMDEVRVYNRVLTAAQVAALYQQSSPGKINTSQNNRLTNGLVGLWSFDGPDISNGVALDRSGQGNNGNLINIATSTFYAAGKVGQGFNFDGTDDYVNTGSGLNFAAATFSSGFTISAWVKPTAVPSTVKAIFSSAFSTSGTNWQVYMWYDNAGKFGSAQRYSGTQNDYVGSVHDAGAWYHVVVAWDGTTSRLYVDGVFENSAAAGQPDNQPASREVRIGNFKGYASSEFNGLIDDVRVYNRALTAAEINSLYRIGEQKINSSQNSRLTAGLVGLWSFNGPDISNGVALDRSGQGNNGNLFNIATSTFYTAGKIGQGFTFDGTNDYVSIPSLSFVSSNSFSFSAWVKGSAQTLKMIVARQDGSTNPDVYLSSGNTSNSKARFWISDGTNNNSGLESTATAFDDTWHHVVGTFSSGVSTLYIDGAASGTNTNGSISLSGAKSLYIGARDVTPANFFAGSIDDVRVYNRALTAAEAKQLYDMAR